jgi:hypothetical protein
MDHGELINRFTYHAPNAEAITKHVDVRSKALDFALWLDTVLPEGRDKSIAFTKLEEVMYSANAAIARNGN